MLVEALEKGLRENQGEYEWNESKIHISDLDIYLEDAGCERQFWLRVRGFDKKAHHAGEKLMFSLGNDIHEKAVNLLKIGLNGWEVHDVEKKVNLEGITGRTDLILKNGNEKMIVDLKSVRGKSFNYLDEPKKSNVLQVQSYMMAEDIDKGRLFYIDREGQNFAKEFPVERNDEKVNKAIKYAKMIFDSEEKPFRMKPKIRYRQNKNNKAVYIKQPWQCNYCRFCDISCKGALPKEYREINRVVGYEYEGEGIEVKPKYKELEGILKEAI